MSDKPISRVSAWEMVGRYAEKAGLSNIKPHDLRRFVGTQLAKKDLRLARSNWAMRGWRRRLSTTYWMVRR
ncbi:MAG: hypothetical protein R2867_05365 [Caldilineaceae bacterium]